MNSTNIYKPILFNTEMVQAILAGRKTQTRRIAPFDKFCTKTFKTGNGKWQQNYNNNPDPNKMFPGGWDEITNYKSKYQAGDILWVRETFRELINCETKEFAAYDYKADMPEEFHKQFPHKWKPSLFMPKKAARILLKVTNVRCERLRDISEGDAISEGVELFDTNLYKDYEDNKSPGLGKARVSFATLWDSINAKKYPWESNPWVWVYDFERIEKPENFI